MLRAGWLIAVPLFVVIFAVGNSQAQIPGHWEQAYTLPGWRFALMMFSDSLHGIIFADSNSQYATGPHWTASAIIRTTDGGTTWHFREVYFGSGVKDTSMYWDFSYYSGYSTVDSLNTYVNSNLSWLLATHDGGLTWEVDTNAFSKAAFSLFIRMFSPAQGRAISNEFIYTFATIDSGRHFYPIGNAPGSFNDAIFLDTSEYWLSYSGPNGSMFNIMEHTTNAGDNDLWTSDTIGDSIPLYYTLNSITQTPDRQRFYVLPSWRVNFAPTPFHWDFVETTDDGATWRIDSALDSVVIYQLSAPAPNRLWALLYPIYYNNGTYTYYNSIVGANFVSYSQDDGHTWYADSTLLGDTLTSMFWPDAEHGYITASQNHSLVVYRFVSRPSGVLPAEQAVSHAAIFPNPAVRSFIINGVAPFSIVHLFDVLGRDVLRDKVPASGSLTLDVSHLPCGIYVVVIEKDGGMVPAGRVVVEER
jgi:hypothetical protein